MTSTPDLSFLIPKKAKTYVAVIGTGLSFVVPFILEAIEGLSSPWPAVIGAVLWVLTALGVYAAPYKPTGTVLAPAEMVKPTVRAAGDVSSVRSDKPEHPWK